MILIYRFFINLIFIISPLLIAYRLLKKKEDLKRFKEKYCIFTKFRKKGKLIWFHGASVGEILSVMPLIEKFEKNSNIDQILITSNTLSSSNILSKYKLKKTIHQFFPLDTKFLSEKFLNYWRPSKVFFIDSEIWPNMIINLSIKKIPLILLNARITKKTFKRWMIFPNFAKFIFKKINLSLPSSIESKNFLIKFGIKKIRYVGNLKYSQPESNSEKLDKSIYKFISQKNYWCASSTHKSEEKICANVHIELKKKFRNIFTIIIPRHVDRSETIKKELSKLNLKVHMHEPKKKISTDTDIYLVNTYGKTKQFYKACKNIFLGGSLINHGGQNPLEAARYNCNIIHGPNVSNFKEIYASLKKKGVAVQVKNQQQLIKKLKDSLLLDKNFEKKNSYLNILGKKILDETYNEIKI